MVDFRKLKFLSPKSRDEIARNRENLIAFQDMGRQDMAAALLERSRTLIDSGCFSDDPRYSYDEWALYRVIPELATRLDPQIELRPEEHPHENEAEDKVTWLRGAGNEKLKSCIASILSNAAYQRAYTRKTEVRETVDLFDNRGGAKTNIISIAANTAFPGMYPDRVTEDPEDSLPGFQVIATTKDDFDQVLKYIEDQEIALRYVDVLFDDRAGHELSDEDRDFMHCMNPSGWGTSKYKAKNAKALSVQAFDGTVIREHVFTPEVELDETPSI